MSTEFPYSLPTALLSLLNNIGITTRIWRLPLYSLQIITNLFNPKNDDTLFSYIKVANPVITALRIF